MTTLLGANTRCEEGRRKLAFTEVITAREVPDSVSFRVATHLLQRWVPKRCEARVIVIGSTLTAVSIEAGNSASFVDWRSDYDALRYELVAPPARVVACIHALVRISRVHRCPLPVMPSAACQEGDQLQRRSAPVCGRRAAEPDRDGRRPLQRPRSAQGGRAGWT